MPSTGPGRTLGRWARRTGDFARDVRSLPEHFADGSKPHRRVRKEQSVVGAVALMRAQLGMAAENPDDLIAKHGMGIIDEMRTDDTITAVDAAFMHTVVGGGGGFIPPKDDPDDKQLMVAGLDFDTARMRGTFSGKLKEIGGSVRRYGFGITERVLAEVDESPTGQRYTLQSLKCREPHSFSFDLDEHGNLRERGLLQTVNGEVRPYKPEDFIIYTHDMEFDNLHGRSAYRAIYRAWFLKKWLINFLSTYAERVAGGILILKRDTDGLTPEDAATGAEVLASIQNMAEIVLELGWSIDFKEASGTGAEVFGNAIVMCNQMIATGLLAPEQLGFTQTDGGSYAKASVQTDLWLGIVEDMQRDLAESVVGEGIIRPLVTWNHPNVADFPTYEFAPVRKDDKFQLLAKIVEAVRFGVLAWRSPGPDEEWVRSLAGLPEGEELPDDFKTIGKTTSTGTPPDDDGEEAGSVETPDADDGEEFAAFPSKALSGGWHRKLTPHERYVDFSGIDDRQRKLDAEAVGAISAVVMKIRQEVVGRVARILVGTEAQQRTAVSKLKIGHVSEIKRIMQAALLMSCLGGKKDVKGEVQRGAGVTLKLADREEYADISGVGLVPAAARKYFKGIPISGTEKARYAKRAFDIAGAESDRMLKAVKEILHTGMGNGDIAWAKTEVRKVFDEYLVTGEYRPPSYKTATGRPEISPASHVETVVRTNLADAYSGGRKALLQDPDVDVVVEAYQWTAILDADTTDYCAALDGQVFAKDEVDWPPAHYNCRSFMIPVFVGEPHSKTTVSDRRDELRTKPQKHPYHKGNIDPARMHRGKGF